MTDTDDEAGARVDDLYARPPGEFTAARDELARSLRSGGDRAKAAEVKKLRRPTVTAWGLNQLVRRHRDEVEVLLQAGEGLRQAQRKALSGLGGGSMREAQQRRRAALDQLIDRAGDLLAERGAVTEAQLTAVRRALEAASVDTGAAADLLEARLSQPPEAATGFDAVAGLTLLEEAQDADAAGTAGEAPPTDEPGEVEQAREGEKAQRAEAERRAAAERAAAKLAEAERAADQAAAEARARREEAEEAARVAAEAKAEVERLSRALESAREQAERAAARASSADHEASAAAETAEQRERERLEAERDLPG